MIRTFHRKLTNKLTASLNNKPAEGTPICVRKTFVSYLIRNTASVKGAGTKSVAFPHGRILKTSAGYETNYHITDHLGSIRAIVKPNAGNNGVQIIEQNDYYPFGQKHKNSQLATSSTNRFLYNGKEKQTTGNLSFLDYGARMYDPTIARWNTTDPLQENRYAWSPYNYAIDNPITRIDPDGRLDDDYFNQHGQFLFSDDKKTDYIKIIHIPDYRKADAIAGERVITPIENTILSDKAITNIVKYYDNKLGAVMGKSEGIKIIAARLEKPSILMAADRSMEHSLGPITIGGKDMIKVNNTNNKINPRLNTGSNIMNTLVHEYRHIPDNRSYFSQPEKGLRALKTQQMHPTFEKTTNEYKSLIEKNIIIEKNKYKNKYGKEYEF